MEMVIVIIVAVTAVSVLNFLAQNTADSQRNIMVQSQAIVLAQTVAIDLTGLLQLQETIPGTIIEFPTKKIQVFNPTFKEKCFITITPNQSPYGNPFVNVGFYWLKDEYGTEKDEYGTDDFNIIKPTRIPDVFTVQTGTVPCGEPIVATRV